MRRLPSTNWLFVVFQRKWLEPIAILLFVVVPSRPILAQQYESSPLRATSFESRYIESKFELATTDPVRDTAFYEKLGFHAVAKTSYGYVTLQSGPVVIALSPVAKDELRDTGSLADDRRPPVGVEIVLYTTANLDKEHAILESLGLKPTPIRLQPWGVRDFRLTDPGGYYIRISEGHALPAK
jgi:lactoylglutathione lyase